MEEYNLVYGKLLNNYTIASWNYDTNITDENSEIVAECQLEMSKYSAEALEIASQFNSTNFAEDTRRQLKEVKWTASVRPIAEFCVSEQYI